MTTTSLLSSLGAMVKAIGAEITDEIRSIWAAAEDGARPRQLEVLAIELGQRVARSVLEGVLSHRNRLATEADLKAKGLEPDQVAMRLDRSYTMSLQTLVGRVQVPLHAYRERIGAGSRGPRFGPTQSPASTLYPAKGKCRSSELCLEWGSRLAGQQPFRMAQELMSYFTFGKVTLEDTTIERHAVRIGHTIEQQWLYRERRNIMEILRKQATRDRRTQRPILYLSCDAHMLRRFVNESWTAEWKAMNGLRLWCEDKETGRTIHIGGEFTCGDAKYLAKRFDNLLGSGIIPPDGDFGDGLVAQYVFVSDGMPWFEERLIKKLPGVVTVLDAYHALDRIGAFIRDHQHQLSSPPQTRGRLFDLLLGRKDGAKKPQPATRRGGPRDKEQVVPRALESPSKLPVKSNIPRIIDEIERLPFPTQAKRQLLEYIRSNAYRMNYRDYRARGFQIGSGAMESIHRTGSQERLKRSGARWRPETLEAMFRLRMLEIVGRWHEWWQQFEVAMNRPGAFSTPRYRTRTGPDLKSLAA